MFVTQAPYKPPTGAYLGPVFVQRLLREPPAMELRHCIAADTPSLRPDAPDRAVFEECIRTGFRDVLGEKSDESVS